MRCRQFITLLGGVTVHQAPWRERAASLARTQRGRATRPRGAVQPPRRAWPLSARAQEKMRRVGMLMMQRADDESLSRTDAFPGSHRGTVPCASRRTGYEWGIHQRGPDLAANTRVAYAGRCMQANS